jgi:hypothetical protein
MNLGQLSDPIVDISKAPQELRKLKELREKVLSLYEYTYNPLYKEIFDELLKREEKVSFVWENKRPRSRGGFFTIG